MVHRTIRVWDRPFVGNNGEREINKFGGEDRKFAGVTLIKRFQREKRVDKFQLIYLICLLALLIGA